MKEFNFVEKEKHGIDFEVAQKIWEDQAGIEIELTLAGRATLRQDRQNSGIAPRNLDGKSIRFGAKESD